MYFSAPCFVVLYCFLYPVVHEIIYLLCYCLGSIVPCNFHANKAYESEREREREREREGERRRWWRFGRTMKEVLGYGNVVAKWTIFAITPCAARWPETPPTHGQAQHTHTHTHTCTHTWPSAKCTNTHTHRQTHTYAVVSHSICVHMCRREIEAASIWCGRGRWWSGWWWWWWRWWCWCWVQERPKET